MNEQENTQKVQEGYAYFGKGDIPSLLNTFSDDIEFDMPGSPDIIPFAGVYRGKEQTSKFFAQLAQEMDFELFEPRQFIAQGDSVAVLGHTKGHAKSTGNSIEDDWMHLFTLRNGQITRLRAFEDTAKTEAAFSVHHAHA